MMNRNKNRFTYRLYSWIFGYDEVKYWKRRQAVVDPDNKTMPILKMWYLIYCKRAEAKNASSMGTALNAGAKFAGVPHLPHGITGIFIYWHRLHDFAECDDWEQQEKSACDWGSLRDWRRCGDCRGN